MKTRANIGFALALIAVGVWFLAVEMSPVVKDFAYGSDTWPIPIMGIGGLLAVLALLTWTPGMFVPACIVAGIGALLFWQNATGNWESWAYAWALIPAFAGVGTLLSGLLTRDRRLVTGGGWTIFNSLVLLAIFGSFLGGSALVSRYWPVLLISLGMVLVVQGAVRRR
ncbi:MAG: hypothetical protein EHM70_19630 [Chloroflexota bacterium]|nr:MAG: hypothetical protein EHM70_19630 [Chloroflexota bacterium]